MLVCGRNDFGHGQEGAVVLVQHVSRVMPYETVPFRGVPVSVLGVALEERLALVLFLLVRRFGLLEGMAPVVGRNGTCPSGRSFRPTRDHFFHQLNAIGS